MATMTTQGNSEAADPVVVRAVEAQAAVCGECAYHVPHATIPGGWCACAAADLRWKPVPAAGAACRDFASWPEGSPASAFLAAIRF